MLSALYIENLAVIEKNYMEIPNGFTVFTGETGAGKSIVIDAINACLGQRTSRDIVRTGAEKANITASFRQIPGRVAMLLEKNGFSADGGELVIDRIIHADGRSSARINGKPATIGMLKEIGGDLINIHGQHDNQILLSPDRHLGLLDSYGELGGELSAYQKKFRELRQTIRKLQSLSQDEAGKKRRAETLRFQIQEIEAAKLSPGIEEQLEEKSKRYRSVEKIAAALGTASQALMGDDEEAMGAVDLIALARDAVSGLSDFPEFAPAAESLEGFYLELSELGAKLYSQLESLEYNREDADAVEERLSQIGRLKSRYGGTVGEILDFAEDARKELESIQSSAAEVRKLTQLAASQKQETAALAKALDSRRREAAQRFISRVAEEARFLEMPDLRLEAAFSPVKLGLTGDTAVEFQISTNPGEPPKPISKIASGGELSRIMLAIKSALAEKDEIDTLIFDEVDTGVSGRAAQKIGMKLRQVAGARQVLCVTHSAQVAAAANSHFLIRKATDGARTYTRTLLLDTSGRVDEIARIMATDQSSGLARETARKMLEEFCHQ